MTAMRPQTRQKLQRSVAAARNILYLFEIEANRALLAPETIAWAKDTILCKTNRPRPTQDRITEALLRAPPFGLMLSEIAINSGLDAGLCSVIVAKMASDGHLHRIAIPMRTRYFATFEAMQVGRPLVDAAERQLVVDRATKKATRRKRAEPAQQQEKPVVEKKTKPPRKIPPPLVVRKSGSVKANFPADAQAVIPPGMQVQLCPGYRGQHERIEAQDGEFMTEWRRLRGVDHG